MMIVTIILSSIIGSISLLSSLIILVSIYRHRKSKNREKIWQTSTNTQTVVHSAPISRRSSSSCLVNLEKLPRSSRTRSASFSEDLSARLQILTASTCYRSYSPATIGPSARSTRSSLGANIRFPIASASTPSTSPAPSITFQLQYEQTLEILSVTIFQLHNHLPIRTMHNTSVILYLLPNDDEQRQTQSSTNGLYNEHFRFPLKSTDFFERTLRLTVYTVDSTTRIRHILGHVFIKFNKFIDENAQDKTFSTHTLSECLTQDLQIRPDHLGELVLTNCYLKDQDLLQIRIQQINHLHMDQTKIKTPLKAYLSGQTSSSCHKHHWTNTTSFIIGSPSFRLDQELNLTVRSEIKNSTECHLRLHLHGSNQIHSHARWQQSLRSSLPTTFNVPLVAL